MELTRLKVMAGVLLVLGLLSAGAGALTYRAWAAGPPSAESPRPVAPARSGKSREAVERKGGGVDRLLERAFGEGCREVRDAAIKLEFRSQRLVVAANRLMVEADRRFCFAPCWLVRYDEVRGAAPPEVLTLRCRALRLTFDRPVNGLADLGRARIVALEPSGEVCLALSSPGRAVGVKVPVLGAAPISLSSLQHLAGAVRPVGVKVPLLGPAPISLDTGFPVRKGGDEREQVFSFWLGLFR
jgi:hypothetical protein